MTDLSKMSVDALCERSEDCQRRISENSMPTSPNYKDDIFISDTLTELARRLREQERRDTNGNWILMLVDPPPEMINAGSNASMEISPNQLAKAYEIMAEWCADEEHKGEVIGTREREALRLANQYEDRAEQAESALLSCQAQVGELRETIKKINAIEERRVTQTVLKNEPWCNNFVGSEVNTLCEEALSHSTGSKIMAVVEAAKEEYGDHQVNPFGEPTKCECRFCQAVRNLQSANEVE